MKNKRFWERLYLLPLLLILSVAIAACGPEADADATPTPVDEIGVPGDPLPPADPTVVVEPTVEEMMPTETIVATEPADEIIETETPEPIVTEPADTVTTPEAMLPHDRVALVRSGDLVGVNIINSVEEVIAQVEDVLFDEQGEIHYVILTVHQLDTGQTTALDYPYYAVEWDAFAISRDHIVPDTQTATGTQPGAQIGFQTGVLLYEEDTINLTGAVGLDDALLDSDDIFYSATTEADVDTDTMDTRMLDGLFRLSAFAHFRLFNPDLVNPQTDDDLGVVEDMLVNVDEGIVQYAVTQIGGWLGIGQTAVVVPWERLSYDEVEEQFLIDATQEELENAPSLDLDQLDDWEIDPEWERETGNYWGTTPLR